MAWIRYFAYFLLITLVTWCLTALEVNYPGSLRIQVFTGPADTLGTSEYSPIELMQLVILGICGGIYSWVGWHYPSQRPLALPLGGLAIAFLVRELDYFLDRFVADNFWQILIAILLALIIAYGWRQRRRLTIALARIWPSPGLVLLFAGAAILFSFVRLVGHEPLWQAVMGDGYQRIVKLAIEEFIEILGYLLWFVGTIEYAYEVRRSATLDPRPAAVRRRQLRTGRRR